MRHTCILYLALLTSIGHAAEIEWSQPFELVSDNDINLSFGPIVYAINGGDNIGNANFIPEDDLVMLSPTKTLTIGDTTIQFEGIDAIYGEEASFGQIGFPFETFGDAVDHVPGDGSKVTFEIRNSRTVDIPQVSFDPLPASLFDPIEVRNYSVGTGNDELDSVLSSQLFMDSRSSLGAGADDFSAGAIGISLNDLMEGTAYQVQIIGGADDRQFDVDPAVIDPDYMAESTSNAVSPIATLVDELGNRVEDLGSFLDLDNDGDGHVTSVLGTFVADGTSQQIEMLLQRGRNVGLSAILLSEAGETSVCGDFDVDGDVDTADRTVQTTNWTGALFEGGTAVFADGDCDSDGDVDTADQTALVANWTGAKMAVHSQVVPEPSSGLLSLLMLSVVLLVRHRSC